MKFEEAINKLNNIISQLEKGSNDLDKSLQLFEEGTALIKECNAMLDSAEQKVTMIVDNKEIPFDE